MRKIELAQGVLWSVQIPLHYVNPQAAYAVQILQLVAIVEGIRQEGLRGMQLSLIGSFFVTATVNGVQLLFFQKLYVDGMFAYILGGLYYVYQRYLYGGGDYDFKPSGKYKVGVSTRFISKKGNFCLVWYPIDDEKTGKVGVKKSGIRRFPYDLEELKRLIMWMDPLGSPPPMVFLKPYGTNQLPASVDAELAADFKAGKQLILVINSHG